MALAADLARLAQGVLGTPWDGLGDLVGGLGVDNPRVLSAAMGPDAADFVAVAFEGCAPALTPGSGAYDAVVGFFAEVRILTGVAVKRELAQDSLLLEDAVVVLKRRREEEGEHAGSQVLGSRPR